MTLAEYVRPQKHNSWFNVILERDVATLTSPRVDFLDSFVTVEAVASQTKYVVLYEGVTPMKVTLQYGFICVWFGDDLSEPAWPFPTLFDRSYGKKFFVSQPRVFKNTNLLDLIENNGDRIHFKTVHRWLSVRLSDYEYTDRVFRLKMGGTIKYARSSDSPLKRRLAELLPRVTYSQDLAFHGPGFGAGQIRADVGLEAQLVLAFTPVGERDLKLHMATSVNDAFLPGWLRRALSRIPFMSIHDLLAWFIASAGINDTDGDYRIWRHRRCLSDPKLLPAEADIIKIRDWLAQFYLKDFEQPAPSTGPETAKQWVGLAPQKTLAVGKVYPFTVAGEELVAYRMENGELRVFEAHCPHHGAHLGHGGRLEEGCLTCPFHHFTFDPDGRWIGSRPDGRPKPLMGLEPVEHRISDDFVEVFM